MDKKYTISVEFEKFTKNYEHVHEYGIIPGADGADNILRIIDKRGTEHNYNMGKVLAYHVEEE